MLNFKGLKIFSDTINTERGDKMLNQFTGIGKVERKEYYYNDIENCHIVLFTINLCSNETKEEYQFYGKTICMSMKESNKTDKVKENDIVAFNGSYIDDSDTLFLKNIKAV